MCIYVYMYIYIYIYVYISLHAFTRSQLLSSFSNSSFRNQIFINQILINSPSHPRHHSRQQLSPCPHCYSVLERQKSVSLGTVLLLRHHPRQHVSHLLWFFCWVSLVIEAQDHFPVASWPRRHAPPPQH